MFRLCVFLAALLTLSSASTSVATNKVIQSLTRPWAEAPEVCVPRSTVAGVRSTKVMCKDCDTAADPGCKRYLVTKTYSDTECTPAKELSNLETTITADDQTYLNWQCYEEHELDSTKSKPSKIYKDYAEIKIFAAVDDEKKSRSSVVPSTWSTLVNRSRLWAYIHYFMVYINKCSALDRTKYTTHTVVTNMCLPFDYPQAKEIMKFSDDPEDEDYIADQFNITDSLFPNKKFFFKVVCDAKDTTHSGAVRWQLYGDPKCTQTTVDDKEYIPVTIQTGCRNWAYFGYYWRSEIKCYGQQSSITVTNAAQSSLLPSLPVYASLAALTAKLLLF